MAVLGCGPAGLFAAQAFRLHGFDPVIISKKQKSVIYGAQYLHSPIPGISRPAPDGHIKTVRLGSPEVYARRVYGVGTEVTSWSRVQPEADVWDLRWTYDRAWELHESRIIDSVLSNDDVKDLTATFDLIISTIPKWAICMHQEHIFQSVNISVKQSCPAELLSVDLGDSWVVYNGSDRGNWYRASNIFGKYSTEAMTHMVHGDEWGSGFKVVGSNCDCHPLLVKAGRLGRWERGVLTHHAFETTIEAISSQYGSLVP